MILSASHPLCHPLGIISKDSVQMVLNPILFSKVLPQHFRTMLELVCSHILWSYKGLNSYWNQVFQLISQVTGILTKPDPALALLHLGIKCFPTYFHTIVIIFLSAESLVTKLWRSNQAPNLPKLIALVNLIYNYGRYIALRNESIHKSNQLWSAWIQITF